MIFTRITCCDVRYDFGKKAMFGSSLPPVVCRKTHVLFTLFPFAWYSGVQHICVVFSSSYVASFSELSIFDCLSIFSKLYLHTPV